MFYLALILLKLVAFPLSLLPRRLFLWLGAWLGLSLRAARFRYTTVEENIALAFPEWTRDQRAQLLRDQYRELGILFLELLRMFFRFDRFFERYVDVEGRENMAEVLAKGKGAFAVTAHLGNWELLTLTARYTYGTTATMVTKELKPAWLHRVVGVTRELLGVQMANEPKTLQGILKGLKGNHIIGMVMDQYAGAPVGCRVPFFGIPVGSHTALATLARRTETPVVPAIAVRRPDGRYLIRFERPFVLPEKETPDATVIHHTALFVKHTEAWVREFPAQWLWIHRRWKGDLTPLPAGMEGELLR